MSNHHDFPAPKSTNQTDIRTFDDLTAEQQECIQSVVRFPGSTSVSGDPEVDRPLFLQMSTLTETGVIPVRTAVCDELLALRVQAKLRAVALSGPEPGSEGDISSRLYVAMPKPKDGEETNVGVYFYLLIILYWVWASEEYLEPSHCF